MLRAADVTALRKDEPGSTGPEAIAVVRPASPDTAPPSDDGLDEILDDAFADLGNGDAALREAGGTESAPHISANDLDFEENMSMTLDAMANLAKRNPLSAKEQANISRAGIEQKREQKREQNRQVGRKDYKFHAAFNEDKNKKSLWQNLKDDALLMMYGDLIDYASFNWYDNEHGMPEAIIPGVSVMRGGKYVLYRPLSNSEKNQIIAQRRAEMLKAIREQDNNYRTKLWLLPFIILAAFTVSLGSAAFISYESSLAFEGLFGASEAVAADLAFAAFFFIFAVNMLIYYFAIRQVTRSLLGYGGFGAGLSYENEPLLRYDHNAKFGDNHIAKLDSTKDVKPLSSKQKKQQIFGMAASAVFSLSLAVLTGKSAENTFLHWMDPSEAFGLAIYVAVFTFVAMFCLTSTAMYSLVRIENKMAAAWRFAARALGMEKSYEVTNWKQFKAGFGWKQVASLIIATAFLAFCISGLIFQGLAQSYSFKRFAVNEMFLLGMVPAELLIGIAMFFGICGKGPFVFAKAINKLVFIKNTWNSIFSPNALVCSPSTGLTLHNNWQKLAVFISIVINSFLQATPAVNNMLDSTPAEEPDLPDSDPSVDPIVDSSDEASVDPINADPEDNQGKEPDDPKPVPPEGLEEGAYTAYVWGSALVLSSNSAMGPFQAASPKEKETYEEENRNYVSSKLTI